MRVPIAASLGKPCLLGFLIFESRPEGAVARNVSAQVRKVTRLEFKGVSVVAALAVGKVTRAKSLDAVVTGSAACFARRGKMHRNRRSTHLPSARSTPDAVTARAAHSLVDVQRVAKVDAVCPRRLGSTR